MGRDERPSVGTHRPASPTRSHLHSRSSLTTSQADGREPSSDPLMAVAICGLDCLEDWFGEPEPGEDDDRYGAGDQEGGVEAEDAGDGADDQRASGYYSEGDHGVDADGPSPQCVGAEGLDEGVRGS